MSEKRKTRRTLEELYPGIGDCVRKYYPTMTAKEIERRFGYKAGAVGGYAYRFGIRSNPEKVRQQNEAALEKARAVYRQNPTKAVAKWKARRQIDKVRIWEGKEPETRSRFQRYPRPTQIRRWHYVRRFGYIPDKDDYLTLYYNGQTRRSNKERYTARRHGFKILPLSERAADAKDKE